MASILSSNAAHPAVRLNAAEEVILKAGGFEIKDQTYSEDPQAIFTKATNLSKSVDTNYASLSGKASYVTGYGKTGRNNDLAADLKKVAGNVAARGKAGSNAEAPSVNGESWRITSASRRALSFFSHVAAEKAGKTYRTY